MRIVRRITSTPKPQRICLRHAIGEQLVVLCGELAFITGDQNDVGRNHVAALMQQLVKRMLAVGTGLAKDHGTRCIVDAATVEIDTLAVRFHFQLLRVLWQ